MDIPKVISLQSAAVEKKLRTRMATHNNGVTIRTSTLPLAGMGVFATRDYAAGTVITEYEGLVINLKNIRQPITHVRTLWSQRWYVDGLRIVDSQRHVISINEPGRQMVGRGLGAFCNDPRGTDLLLKDLKNVVFQIMERAYRPSFKQPASDMPPLLNPLTNAHNDPVSRFVVVTALRAIRAGEELLIDYGEDFWEKQHERKRKREEEEEEKQAIERGQRKRITPTPIPTPTAFCFVCQSPDVTAQWAGDNMYKICDSNQCRAIFEDRKREEREREERETDYW